jgi:predicted nucleic acid-binding protein
VSGFTFDSNIIIDALTGLDQAEAEFRRAAARAGRLWISRMVWVEVLSKGAGDKLRLAEKFLSGFTVDEIDAEICGRAAALRRERTKLRSPDAIILATAQLRSRILVTRNTKDFPADLPGIRVPYTL